MSTFERRVASLAELAQAERAEEADGAGAPEHERRHAELLRDAQREADEAADEEARDGRRAVPARPEPPRQVQQRGRAGPPQRQVQPDGAVWRVAVGLGHAVGDGLDAEPVVAAARAAQALVVVVRVDEGDVHPARLSGSRWILAR